jgi:tetratricopeptide (TPR) repeat protein
MQTNPILFKEFSEISSVNVVSQELDSIFFRDIDPEKVKIIFKDYNNDEFASYKLEISDRCSKALLVSYPHSCHIYSRMDTDSMSICEDPDAYSKHDIFLLGSENDIPYWSEFVDVKKIRTLGTPRYDTWYLNIFLNDPQLNSTQEFKASQKASKVFFYISRGVHPHYLSQPDYDYIVKSIADAVFKYDDSLLLIKPHPRQDIGELFKLLAPYDKQRCLVSGLHLFQLSSMADVVISGWSSGMLDALAVGKPVIEFWRFGGKDPLCRKTPEGKYTTIYRELGLAAAADTKEELEPLLENALKNPGAPVWKSQVEAFKTWCKPTDDVSQNIARLLEAELEKISVPTTTRISETSAAEYDQQDELIDHMIEYVSFLVENQMSEKASAWFQFMCDQFLDNVKILNNYSIFLFNQGEIKNAIDYLVKCLNQTPSYREAAVNLIQILLIVDQIDEALDIVVAYYAQANDEKSKRFFLQALADQLTEQQFGIVHEKIAHMRQ